MLSGDSTSIEAKALINALSEKDLSPEDRYARAQKALEAIVAVKPIDEVNFETSPLGMASSFGFTKIVTLLLEKKADPDQLIVSTGQRPLTIAVRQQDIATVQALLDKKANPNEANITNTGSTSLMIAAEQGNKAILTLLLDHGAILETQNKKGMTAFFLAVQHRRLQIVTSILERIPEQRKTNLIEARIKAAVTALLIAVDNGDLDMVTVLLQNKANPNARDMGSGTTPLTLACSLRHTEIAKLLVEHKADSNKIDSKTTATPLIVAAKFGELKMVEFLLSKQANPNQPDLKGRTPLHNAAARGHESVITLLLEAKADSRLCDFQKRTALDCAVEMKKHAATAALLAHIHNLFVVSKGLRFSKEIFKNERTKVELADYHERKDGEPLRVAVKSSKYTMDELNIYSALVKANIPAMVPLVGIASTADSVCLVTEYMQEGSLRNYLHKYGPILDPLTLVEMADDLASGFEAMHKNNFFHGDIKSENIFVTIVDKKPKARIGDFGHSRRYGSPFAVGTYLYLPPQEKTRSAVNDEAFDIYSFGITCWEMITGKFPSIPEDKLKDDNYKIKGLRENSLFAVPPDHFLAPIVSRCLRPEAEQRPSFAVFRFFLAAAKTKLPDCGTASKVSDLFTRPACSAMTYSSR